MSSISGLSNSTNLYSLLQLTNAQDSSQTGTAAANTLPIPNADGDDSSSAAATSAAHGHRRSGVSNQIESAVTTALQNAADGTDPNNTIKQAIASVLDPTGSQTASSTDSTDTSDSSSTGATTSFNQLLQANGVDPQQFQQDLADALQPNSANGTSAGNVDFAALFRSFPPGSTVDTLG